LPTSSLRTLEWASHYSVLFPAYANDLDLARRHATQVADWIANLLANTITFRDAVAEATANNATAPSVPDDLLVAADFEDRIAVLLFNQSILPVADWGLIMGAQLGSNAVMGYAYKVSSDRMGGLASRVQDVSGIGITNTCPQSPLQALSGSSLFDDDNIRLSYEAAAIPELSCWGNRVLPTPDDFATMTFYSKIDPERMQALINLFTSGTSLYGFSTPGSLLA